MQEAIERTRDGQISKKRFVEAMLSSFQNLKDCYVEERFNLFCRPQGVELGPRGGGNIGGNLGSQNKAEISAFNMG